MGPATITTTTAAAAAAAASAATAARRCSRHHSLPAVSNLLHDALPQLRAQFDLHATTNANVFPLLSPPQHARVLSQWKMPPPPINKPAAVLVPLLLYQGQPSILFTKRASHLSRHASEISFPGGHVEEGDATLIDTALREAMEELLPTTTIHRTTSSDSTSSNSSAVVPPHHQPITQTWLDASCASSSASASLEILGYATTLPSKRFMPVTPVVAVCPMEITTPTELQNVFPGNPQEVDRVFCVSLQELLRVETTQSTSTMTRRMAARQAPMFVSEEHGTIWGLTAYILQPLLHQLFQPVLLPEWTNHNTTTARPTPTTTTTSIVNATRSEPQS